MSFKSVINSVGEFFGRVFHATNLTAVEAWVAKVSPLVAADLEAFSATLPGEFASLEKLAEKAITLVHDLKGVTISKSLAVQLAQSAYTANKADIEAEAAKLLKL
ncbi:MAG: hypothetical protein ACRYGI_11630 [Janthinobacterium lividum]